MRLSTPTMDKCKHKIKSFGILFFLLLVLVEANARPRLSNLNIYVELSDNGDARITEKRLMEIDSQGTECYIVIDNLNGSEVKDLGVTDETGLAYANIGEWNIDRSREWKTGKCGIVYKRSGYELCWGLGQEGTREYTTSYTVTKLVKAYDDVDGFNYMFVAEDITPAPDHVKLTIMKPGTPFIPDTVGVWAFRFHGNIMVEDSCIVAESSEPFTSESAMIVMASFPKGMFHPTDVRQGKFNQVQDVAFEGSDYIDNRTWWQKLKDNIEMLFFLLFIGLTMLSPLLYIIYRWWKKRKFRKNLEKELAWYRDIPYQGDLHRANSVCNAIGYASYYDTKDLLSAYIMRMLYRGELEVKEASSLNSDKVKQNICIGHEPVLDTTSLDNRLENKLYHIFSNAAGEDKILQPKELERWMGKNWRSLEDFVNQLKPNMSLEDCKREIIQVRQVTGLRKFLKDFTLVNERHVSEIALWKDYLVYASLFGIADQVRKDMQAINPEFFKMDKMAQQMAESTVVLIPNISHATLNGTQRVKQRIDEREARSIGGGGHASWGGGGGFSGGGVGGGVR